MKEILHFIFLTLAIIGSLNWGLVGIAGIDLVKLIFGDQTLWANLVYSSVGLSGIYLLIYSLKESNI